MVGKSLDVLHIPSPHYLQRVDVSFLASGAVSGRGHWSRKARPSPSWAPLSSGCSPPQPDHYCCQTPHWRGLGDGGMAESRRKRRKKDRKQKMMVMRGDLIIFYSQKGCSQSRKTARMSKFFLALINWVDRPACHCSLEQSLIKLRNWMHVHFA